MPFDVTQEACPHAWDEAVMVVAFPDKTVHRDECAYCCRTARHGDGVYVCMACHTGLCAEHLAKHQDRHETHAMYTLVKELPAKAQEEVKDVNYLGVLAPKEYETAVCCGECAVQFAEVPELALAAYMSVIHAAVPGAQESAAEGGFGRVQKPQCPHLVCLEQQPSPFVAGPPTSENVCSVDDCDCCVNNWMCVTCGAVGCPRSEAGGKAHALRHYAETGHPVTVKLGTITAQSADYYCYACDDDVDDVHFAAHMAHFGIDIHTAKKTAKTMGELEYDYSAQFDFNKITEAGADLVPAHGPGHTGIVNIGNSCYLASVVQCLMALPPFQHAFYPMQGTPHQAMCTMDPYHCRHCQVERLASGLLSGEFSCADAADTNGVCPRLFKKVFAQQHPEFSTAAQQDAQEYLLYLLEEMHRHIRGLPEGGDGATHPADVTELVMEQRVECGACGRVRYSYEMDRCLSLPIPLEPVSTTTMQATATAVHLSTDELDAVRPRCSLASCLDASTAPNMIECRCEACGTQTYYSTVTRPASFPLVLPVYIRRTYFDVATLNTKKMDAYVDVPTELTLEDYRGTGLKEGEVLMPATAPSPTRRARTDTATAAIQEVDEMALVSVISMGIDPAVARYALRQTNMNVERAVDYIFSHPNIAVEAEASAEAPTADTDESTTGAPGSAATAVAVKPAPPTDGAASYELAAMISHVGASARTGHYVCHIKDAESGKWLLFNDEKVGESQNPPFAMASLYFFRRAA